MQTHIGNTLKEAKLRLKNANINTYALDAELLLMHVTGVSKEQLLGYPEKTISNHIQKTYIAYLNRRVKREPVASIIGKKEFFGREFLVSDATLHPRPDSETLIEAALSYYKNGNGPSSVLDLGVGSGCLLLTLLSEYPKAYGLGVDCSNATVKMAKANAEKLGLAKRADFSVNNWCRGVEGRFDLIISNPPYIKEGELEFLEPEVKCYEPKGALVAGKDGLKCYREIAPYIKERLNDNGVCIIECGIGQGGAIKEILQEYPLTVFETKKDLRGITRCVLAKSN